MAIYHLTAKWHTRSKNKKLRALRAYAYRAGARVIDPLNSRVYNSTNKKEVVFCETLLPPGAPEWMRDPIELWGRAVEGGERRSDSVLFAEWVGALPNELDIEACKAIASAFVNDLVVEGMVISWALHDKPGNRHFHAMATTRHIKGEQFGVKNHRWRQLALLYKTRERFAQHINEALEKAGFPQRVTHKSYADLGIDREPTKHVGPEYSGKQDTPYQAKREDRMRHNRRVKTVYQQRSKRRRAEARPSLVAGVQAGKLMTALRDQLDDSREASAAPLTPSMSADAVAAHEYMHTEEPGADEIFLAMGRVRAGLGRQWNWPTLAAQYKRLDKKSGGDVLDTLLVKDLIWVASRSPEQISEFGKLVPRSRMANIATAARAWAHSSQPEVLHLIDSMVAGAAAASPNDSDKQAMPASGASPEPDFLSYADAFTPLAYLITDMAALVGTCQQVARSIEKKISPDILAKRINRLLAGDTWPANQAQLLDALITGEIVFAAKRRQHKLADALNAVPPDHRSHFEHVVASVLGACVVDAGHAVASRALPAQAQMEVQAECNVRMALSDWQLADYPIRCIAMKAMGKEYLWSEFQRDIQRHAQHHSGWQTAWWQEKQVTLQGRELAAFRKHLPAWFGLPRPQQYSLAAHDPNPSMSMTRDLRGPKAATPEPSQSEAVGCIYPAHLTTEHQPDPWHVHPAARDNGAAPGATA
ncbi:MULTISPECIES: MobA/MobL family protein [unclassified Acidovorax]|jgi:hypothetical protein|uniref:MobA/MobL family protein n=1 Tax=unclassified Acidovorax TaxID=2684926 RepID=UPI0025C35191|nr:MULTISPECIES: MobA/MobL family protein [unclassified Acidovorax]HQS22007.1 MobA/MobL family protein [Acidovorax defluvii]HQS63757.1 MobA/MobL family protein [Acidovorax defluvii]HQT18211.1 MobA/MobL family protein [Acidovorax defluvii]HQT50832.1 MobA/MobL family protein [Acidovorax defluvii]